MSEVGPYEDIVGESLEQGRGKNEILNEKPVVKSARSKLMSMHPQPIPTIPEETARVAHAVLPQGNVYLQLSRCKEPHLANQSWLDHFRFRLCERAIVDMLWLKFTVT